MFQNNLSFVGLSSAKHVLFVGPRNQNGELFKRLIRVASALFFQKYLELRQKYGLFFWLGLKYLYELRIYIIHLLGEKG